MVGTDDVDDVAEVADVADELYALSPREFIAARDARAAEAKKAGDRDTADRIKELRKPTVTAWLANQLVRRHADEVGPLLELGAALRDATDSLSGPELRQLSRQRHEVVQALIRQARLLAKDAGQPVSEEVARGLGDTLDAALADPAAAEALMAGRLTEGLTHTGFGLSAASGASAPAPRRTQERKKAPRSSTSVADRRRAERRARLEEQHAGAWAAARAAADARTTAEAEAARADEEAGAAERRVTDLRADLDRAEAELEQATARRAQARSARKAAGTAAERATREVSRLQNALDEL
jgi:hypothetical protein